MSAEALAVGDVTPRVESQRKKERRQFWNRVLGRSVLVLAGAIALAAYLTPLAPVVSPLAYSLLQTTAGLGILGGEIGTGFGLVGRGATVFTK